MFADYINRRNLSDEEFIQLGVIYQHRTQIYSEYIYISAKHRITNELLTNRHTRPDNPPNTKQKRHIYTPLHIHMHITTTMNSEYCPFCNIASTYPPQSPLTFHPGTTTTHDDRVLPPLAAETSEGTNSFPSQSQSHAYVILSTKSILAFLDIMPLTRGHVLVVPREHCPTLGDVGVRVGREVCLFAPIPFSPNNRF